MKNLILSTLACGMLYSSAFAQQDGAIDDVGDIAFVAWSASNQDGYAFVLLDDCPNGTSIKFIDEKWTGTSFYSSNGEGENTWTNNTGSTIDKGVVIIIENADNNPTCNIGSVTESDAGFDIASSSADQIFAIVGSRSSPTFLAMIGHVSLPNNASGAVQTLSGTGLTSGVTAVHQTGESLYDGSTTCNSNVTACLQMINNSGNWSGLTSSITFPSDVDTLFDGSVLPVTLTSFTCTRDDDCTYLYWTTAMEINNAGFELQRRSSVTDWRVLNFIPGIGNSNSLQNYYYIDHHNEDTEVYLYRLKQMDYDGCFTYSSIIKSNSVYLEDQQQVNCWIDKSNLTVQSTEQIILRITLYNSLGQCNKVLEPYALYCNYELSSENGRVLYVLVELSNRREMFKLLYQPDG